MNQQNNKPYNVTIIYDTPKEAGIVTHTPETAKEVTEAEKILAPWQIAALFGVVLALLLAGGAFSWIWNGKEDTSENTTKAEVLPKNPFDGMLIEARAAFVFDIKKQKILYAKNEETQLPLASLTKLMTALIAEETLPKGDAVVVGKDAIAEEGDNGLLVGERWRKDDLIALTLLASSNDGAHALASAVEIFQKENKTSATSTETEISFTKIMNTRARDLGMDQTYFLNAAGLDVQKNESGAYGSARDVAALLEFILRNHSSILDATPYEKMTFTSKTRNTNLRTL